MSLRILSQRGTVTNWNQKCQSIYECYWQSTKIHNGEVCDSFAYISKTYKAMPSAFFHTTVLSEPEQQCLYLWSATEQCYI